MKICLCGSTRFKENFEAINEKLSQAGHVVYSVAFFGHARAEPLSSWEKQRLDLVHLVKILDSDAIFVVGSLDGHTAYIGESTRREIFWARMHSKHEFYQVRGDIDQLIREGRHMVANVEESS